MRFNFVCKLVMYMVMVMGIGTRTVQYGTRTVLDGDGDGGDMMMVIWRYGGFDLKQGVTLFNDHLGLILASYE